MTGRPLQLTEAEWRAVIAAFALADADWEDEVEHGPAGRRMRLSLNRAQFKIERCLRPARKARR